MNHLHKKYSRNLRKLLRMKIKEIYSKYGITPNLAEHMMRVTAVALYIGDHWKGPELDWNKVKITALLHDLGNIVRFDFDKYPQFLGPEQSRIDYWKKVQAETIAKYGNDDHDATKKMLEELKVDGDITKVILEKSFGNSVQISKSDNWYTKILSYCDNRLMPNGIVTLEERIKDTLERAPKYANRPDFEDLCDASREIEKQIQGKMDVSVNKISNESVKVDNSLIEVDI
jgi:hypothetical protein